MGEEFHAIIKLVSGEELFCLLSVDDNDEENPILILQNPIVVTLSNNQAGSYIKVKSWMELSDEDIFLIRLDKVITVTESKDQKLIDIYNHYISDEKNGINSYKDDGSVRPNSKMGYVTSVKDARRKLEHLFKLKHKES